MSDSFSGNRAAGKETCRSHRQVQKGARSGYARAATGADIYGYLPYEVMQRIAEGLDTSMEEIYGVATFYAQFSLYPKGQYNVSVCLGTACYVKSSGEVMDKLKSLLGVKEGEITPDGRFSIQATRCIGCCGLAPVLTVNEEVYGKVTVADVEGIINTYRNK